MSTEIAGFESKYVAKKALFSFLGSVFRIYSTGGELQFYNNYLSTNLEGAEPGPEPEL